MISSEHATHWIFDNSGSCTINGCAIERGSRRCTMIGCGICYCELSKTQPKRYTIEGCRIRDLSPFAIPTFLSYTKDLGKSIIRSEAYNPTRPYYPIQHTIPISSFYGTVKPRDVVMSLYLFIQP